MNPNPFHQWYGIENVGKVRVNRESCIALLGHGTQINTITPNFVKSHSLEVGPLSDLGGRQVACVGLGNALTQLVGYIAGHQDPILSYFFSIVLFCPILGQIVLFYPIF